MREISIQSWLFHDTMQSITLRIKKSFRVIALSRKMKFQDVNVTVQIVIEAAQGWVKLHFLGMSVYLDDLYWCRFSQNLWWEEKILFNRSRNDDNLSICPLLGTATQKAIYLSSFAICLVFYSASGEDVRLMLWDTAGQEEFDAITKAYYRGAEACVVAFSTTDRASFDAVKKWKRKVEDECGHIPMVLVQNKIDLMHESQVDK